MIKEIIAVVNRKGGAGKTTTSQSLGEGLKLKGNKVLFIDMDGQGNLSNTLKADKAKPTIFDVLTRQENIKRALQDTEQGDIVASDASLFAADIRIIDTGKEYRLKEAIAAIIEEYDYIIIDTPPALGILTINALCAARSVIIPIQADAFSLQGIQQISETIAAVRQYCNQHLQIKGILLTRHNKRTILSRDVVDVINNNAKAINTKLYKSTIRECIAIKEAQLKKTNIYAYAPKSNAALDYMEFVEEYLKDV
jgi:chromosome partitioning protein